MLASQNRCQQNAPLALRLKIDDLRAQVAPLDRYGFPGLSSAITDAIRQLAGACKRALRGVGGGVADRGCEPA